MLARLGMLAVAACGIGLCAGPDNGDEIRREFWPEVDVYLRINDKSRIYSRLAGTRQGSLNAYSDGQAGIFYDRWLLNPIRFQHRENQDVSLSKTLMFRAGYQFARPKDRDRAPTEHSVTGEGTGKLHFPWEVLLSDRNRFDFRWLDGRFQWRYRNRIKVERRFPVGPVSITPYFHTEFFYSLDQGRWTRIRYSTGGEVAVFKRVALDVYLLRQTEFPDTRTELHGMGAALKFYLR